MRIRVQQVYIVEQDVDAVVKAANVTLLGGGGVDGAIHRAAGPELLQVCRAIAEIAPGVRLRPAQAVITPGFRLAARYIIHCAAPIFSRCRSSHEAHTLLADNYRACIELASARGLSTVAFPALGCGVYGFSHEESAPWALAALAEAGASAKCAGS